jgi:hypothetical protein
LESNQKNIEKHVENNLENGKEYAGLIKTQYQNLMLDKRVIIIKERLVRHKLFIPQEVVQREVWIGGLQKSHNYKQQFPCKEMQLTIHPNEWVQYTF